MLLFEPLGGGACASVQRYVGAPPQTIKRASLNNSGKTLAKAALRELRNLSSR